MPNVMAALPNIDGTLWVELAILNPQPVSVKSSAALAIYNTQQVAAQNMTVFGVAYCCKDHCWKKTVTARTRRFTDRRMLHL